MLASWSLIVERRTGLERIELFRPRRTGAMATRKTLEQKPTKESRSDSEKLPSRTEAEILTFLISREMYGLELVSASVASRGRLRKATIYIYLHRMEAHGFVASKLTEHSATGGPPRRKYRITAVGRRALGALEAARSVWGLTTIPA
jgi:DNA-binding PadR family transcriptional regulator